MKKLLIILGCLTIMGLSIFLYINRWPTNLVGSIFMGLCLLVGAITIIRVFEYYSKYPSFSSMKDYFNWFKEQYPNIHWHYDEDYLVSPSLHKNKEYILVEEFWGYAPAKDVVSIITKHNLSQEQDILIRRRLSSMETGTMYDQWGVYKGTGKLLQ
jgi:hypothetical protein